MGSTVACDLCVDIRLVTTLGPWRAKRSDPFWRHLCCGLESLRCRESVVDEKKARRDSLSICTDLFVVCPLRGDVRRASPIELRRVILRVKNPSAPDASGLEDILGRGGEVPAEGTSLLPMAAHGVLGEEPSEPHSPHEV